MDDFLFQSEAVDVFSMYANSASGVVPQLDASHNHDGGPRRILVLEDDSVQRYLLRQQLDSVGLQSIPAETLQEAWQLLQEGPIHLAILDMQLPDGCGLDLCRRIDEDNRLMGLPMLVLSSSTRADVIRQTRAAGACYFISKPYDPNVLLARIEQVLGNSL